jgi:hypothetical protein
MSGGGHRTMKLTRQPWMYCVKCGLVFLRNKLTQAAARGRCKWDE